MCNHTALKLDVAFFCSRNPLPKIALGGIPFEIIQWRNAAAAVSQCEIASIDPDYLPITSGCDFIAVEVKCQVTCHGMGSRQRHVPAQIPVALSGQAVCARPLFESNLVRAGMPLLIAGVPAAEVMLMGFRHSHYYIMRRAAFVVTPRFAPAVYIIKNKTIPAGKRALGNFHRPITGISGQSPWRYADAQAITRFVRELDRIGFRHIDIVCRAVRKPVAADYGTAGHFEGCVLLIAHTASIDGGCIAADGAACHFKCAAACCEHASAAAGCCRIAADSAALHGKGGSAIYIHAASIVTGRIIADGTALHGESSFPHRHAATFSVIIAVNLAAIHDKFAAINIHAHCLHSCPVAIPSSGVNGECAAVHIEFAALIYIHIG